MATKPQETTRGGTEALDAEDGASDEASPAPKASGGLKAWLPLIVSVITMPILAFVMTQFVILPKLERASGQSKTESTASAPGETAAASESSGGGKESGKAGATGKVRIAVPLSKMLVNVAGTMGTRYLMTSVTLVGTSPDFKEKIENNKDQLMDLATGALSSKTISDLEKPGARNVIKAEITTVLNNALGGPVIQDVYITELAIQ